MQAFTTRRDFVDSLTGTTCPACNGRKKPHQTLCSHDYFSLPSQLRQDLYKRIGAGYEQALTAALQFLEAKKATQAVPARPPTSRPAPVAPPTSLFGS